MGTTHDLTWGQLAQYDHLRNNGFSMDVAFLTGIWSVPLNTDAHAIEAAFRRLVGRHESLRSVFVEDEPQDEPGRRVRQQVLDVAVISIAHEHLPDNPEYEALVDLGDRTRPRVLDPLSVHTITAVLVSSPAGAHVVVVHVSHMAVDFAGLLILETEFHVLLAEPAREGELLPARQPWEQAVQEASPQVEARALSAGHYHAAMLRRAPLAFLTTGSLRSTQIHTVADGFVPLLSASAITLSRLCGVPLPAVLSGLLSLQLARVTGERDVLLRSLFGRRQWSRRSNYVAPQNLAALVGIPVDLDATVSEFLHAAYGATLRGYRHTDYNPRALDAAQRDAERYSGREFDGYVLFNFLGGSLPEGAQSSEATERPEPSMLLPRPTTIAKNYRFLLNCVWVPEESGLYVELSTENAFLGLDAAEVVDALERLAGAAAENPATRVGDLPLQLDPASPPAPRLVRPHELP